MNDKEVIAIQYRKISELEQENKKLKEELKKDDREVQVDVDKELLKANDYLIKENKNLKESLDIATKCSSKEEDGIIRLSEENKLLKNEIAWLKDHTKYNGITEEHYIDGTMTATEARLRLQQAEDNKNYISKLEEENKKLSEENGQLKSDLSFKETMLDNVSAEYDSLQNVIKKLNERIRFLEQCLDNKEKVNKSLREENKRLSDFLECES